MSLIKLAVAKWRTFLNAATSNHDLQNRVGKLLVGSQAPKTFGKAAKGYAGFTANVTTQPLSKDLLDQSKNLKTLVEETVAEIRVFEEKLGIEIPVIAGGGSDAERICREKTCKVCRQCTGLAGGHPDEL